MLNELHRKICKRTLSEAGHSVSITEINNRTAIYFLLLNPALKRDDVLETIKYLQELAREESR